MKDSNQNPSATPETTDGRATTFQAVQGGQEHYSGETLLGSAYAVLWALILAWGAFIWRKQGQTNARLFDLERVLDKAAADKATTRKT